MDYRSFFHPAISAAKDPAPDHLVSGEEEDGDLYAELWQQILQLTAGSDDKPAGPTNQCPFPVPAPSPVTCSDWQVTNRNVEPSPVRWLGLPRSGSGTGVFIPSTAATKRGGHLGRAARWKKAAKKQVEHK